MRTRDSINLIEYSFNNYELIDISEIINEEYNKWKNENSIEIYKGKQNKVETVLYEIPYKLYPVKKDQIKDLKCTLTVTNYIQAPVNEKDTLGKIELKILDKQICSVNINSKNTIEKKDVLYYFIFLLKQVNFIMS